MNEKRKEMTSHERSFSYVEKNFANLKIVSASPCKKRKYKNRSDLKFDGHSYDPDIGISNHRSVSVCDLTFTPKSSKFVVYKMAQNTDEFEHTPLARAEKPNTSIKSHSLIKQKSKIEEGSIEKLKPDIKSSSHCSHFQNDFLANSTGRLRFPRKMDVIEAECSSKVIEIDTHNSHISLLSQTESDIEEKIDQRHKQLEGIRSYLEESEPILFAHMNKERHCIFDGMFERFKKDTCAEIVDLKSMKILKSGKWVKLQGKHLHPRVHYTSDETTDMLKNKIKLVREESKLKKGLKRGSSKYSSQDFLNSMFNRFILIDEDFSQDTFSSISSDTDEAPVKLHSILNNSNSLSNQSNLLKAESAIDSDESHVTLPLHSSRDLETPQEFGGPNKTSVKQKHSHKLISNSPPVSVNRNPVQCTFIRKAKSTRNVLRGVPENSAYCTSKSSSETPTKRKISDKDMDICHIAKKCFDSSSKPKQTPTRRDHNNRTKYESVRRYDELYSNIPFDVLQM